MGDGGGRRGGCRRVLAGGLVVVVVAGGVAAFPLTVGRVPTATSAMAATTKTIRTTAARTGAIHPAPPAVRGPSTRTAVHRSREVQKSSKVQPAVPSASTQAFRRSGLPPNTGRDALLANILVTPRARQRRVIDRASWRQRKGSALPREQGGAPPPLDHGGEPGTWRWSYNPTSDHRLDSGGSEQCRQLCGWPGSGTVRTAISRAHRCSLCRGIGSA